MPIKGEKYHLVPFRKGWRVMADNGTFYSKKALTLQKAKAQQRALYAAQRRGEIFHGSGYSCITHGGRTDIVLKGSGWIGDFVTKMKAAAGAVASRAKSIVTKGIRNDYNPNARAIISKYGGWRVVGVRIRREPIKSFINKALDFITRGQWSKAKDDLNYDKLYHLSLMLTLESPDGQLNDVLVEKNAVVNISDSYNANADQQFKTVNWNPPQSVTFAEFLQRGREAMGANFFPYDAFNNNCQNFVIGLLRANGVADPDTEAFVLQPVDQLLRRLPFYASPVANVVTNIAGLADVAIYGEGKDIVMKSKDFFAEHKKLVALLDGIAEKLKDEAKEQSTEAKGWKRKLEAKTTHMYGGVRLNGMMVEAEMDGGSMCGCGPIRGRFKSYLAAREIDPQKYLDAAKAAAKKTGYDPRALEFSDDDEHKLMIYNDEGKVRRFGRVGYGDFIIHSMAGAQSVADKKRDRFRKSHMAMGGDWKKDKYSPNWLAINILW
jgi:hypothetical protein